MSLEGLKAPEFMLKGSDGKDHALPDYRGKTVVIYKGTPRQCAGCHGSAGG